MQSYLMSSMPPSTCVRAVCMPHTWQKRERQRDVQIGRKERRYLFLLCLSLANWGNVHFRFGAGRGDPDKRELGTE